MKKYNLNAQIRIRATTRAKIDRLTGTTHLTISELIDVLVSNALANQALLPTEPPVGPPGAIPLVALGPGGDFVRYIYPEDLKS